MAWSPEFVVACTRSRSPRYYLEVLEVADEPRGTVGYAVGSHRGLGTRDDLVIAAGSVRVQGQSISPASWSSTIGAFSLELVGDPTRFFGEVTRGTFVALYCGFGGMARSEFQRIAVGVVKNMRGVPPRLRVECWDLRAGLRQRPTRTTSQLRLFYNVASTTTLTANYTAGAGTLTVNATSAFQRETGGTGCVKVTPTTGDPFYLTYTGTSATTFTGVSSTGKLGTTAVNAVSTDQVLGVGYVKGHPMDVIRKILTSKEASNGSHDVLPKEWGLGLPYWLLDNDDTDRWESDIVKVSSGSYDWEVHVESYEEDAMAFLEGLMAEAGLFFSIRQGSLTIRAAQDTIAAGAYLADVEITDADIEEIEDYEAFDVGFATEYGRANVYTYSGSTGTAPNPAEDPATLPCGYEKRYDLSDRVYDNQNAIADETALRLHESAADVPERIVARCASLRLAQLCPGDVTELTTRRVHSRIGGSTGLDGRRVFIDEVTPDWERGTVRLGILVYPTSGSEVFPSP